MKIIETTDSSGWDGVESGCGFFSFAELGLFFSLPPGVDRKWKKVSMFSKAVEIELLSIA